MVDPIQMEPETYLVICISKEAVWVWLCLCINKLIKQVFCFWKGIIHDPNW